MFTGLIEEIGRLRSVSRESEGARLVIEAAFSEELAQGESVAIDGACLTVETREPGAFSVFASPETLKRTTLRTLAPGAPVNLERSLAVGERLGGHWVQGHVDETGRVQEVSTHGLSRLVTFEAPQTVLNYLVDKGSVAVDGISLTVSELQKQAFSVWIIPETWEGTTLRSKKAGAPVNLECDLIAKYVFRYLDLQGGRSADPAERDAALTALLRQGGWATRPPSKGR